MSANPKGIKCLECGNVRPIKLKVCPWCLEERRMKEAQRRSGTLQRFRTGAWYCAHCPIDPRVHSYANKYHVAQHTWQDHGVQEPEEGVDYMQGFAAQKKWAARQLVADSFEHKAFRAPGYSLIDFQADVGINPGPDEPPFPKITDKRMK